MPIAAGCAGLVVAAAFGYGWPWLERGMDALSHAVLGAGEFGLFAYGVLNRALIVTGLHHILNNIAWFLLGDYGGVTGDLKRFFAGDPSAGAFMSGFFPVMMFGLPAACLAMYHAAEPGKRRAAGGLLLSMALTSFLTGVTEPIEFTFMFLAPLLYGVHAVLTGLAMVLMNQLGVRLGFSFSAGLFDYVINFGQATRPWLLLPSAPLYALVYRDVPFVIVRFALRTPGREEEAVSPVEPALESSGQAAAMIAALGGAGNLSAIDACTTRLRSMSWTRPGSMRRRCAASGARRRAALEEHAAGRRGPIADQLAGELRTASRLQAPATQLIVVQPATTTGAASIDVERQLVDGMLHAFGGRKNVADVAAASTRLLVTVRDGAAVDGARSPGAEAARRRAADPERVHLLIGATADAYRVALQGPRFGASVGRSGSAGSQARS